MNEETQLKAIEAEYVAGGFRVARDVSGDDMAQHGLEAPGLEGLTLDFVASRERKAEPALVIVVEVANRTRRMVGPMGRTTRLTRRQLFDEEALGRFDRIAEALAASDSAELQIRFLDVSAEQAAARRNSAPFRSSEPMAGRLVADRALLARSSSRDALSHALLVARLWAFWLRVVANRFPGRHHREMKDADLRTLQKDLYDSGVLEMGPGRYRLVHGALLAIVEGGDFEPGLISGLESDLRLLLAQVGEWYGAALSTQTTYDGPEGTLKEIWREIAERRQSADVEDAEIALTVLTLTQGTSAFPAEVARFQLAVGRRGFVSEDLITRLIEEAAGIG